MKISDMIRTPRFGMVKIKAIYTTQEAAVADGFTESTHYDWSHHDGWAIAGKSTDEYRMIFAAYRI